MKNSGRSRIFESDIRVSMNADQVHNPILTIIRYFLYLTAIRIEFILEE